AAAWNWWWHEMREHESGWTGAVRAGLSEPYFSTKPDGTGLGLAIVSAIVSDHHGFIRVRDNVPRGSRFVMEFPVRRPTLQLAVGATPVAYGACGERGHRCPRRSWWGTTRCRSATR